MEILPALPENSIDILISQALDKNVPVETLERLLAMRRELKMEYAKDQYTLALSNFQAICPTIKKTREARDKDNLLLYKFAPLDIIVSQVKGLLRENGFSYKMQTETFEASVKATCVITHIYGHSEDTSVQLPFINRTRAMSESQVVEGTLTIAKRLAFCNGFGILTSDEDLNGAFPGNVPQLEDRHIAAIRILLSKTDRVTEEQILQRCKVESLEELTLEQAKKVLTALNKLTPE